MPRVIFVMLDGLRPDAINPERTPNLERVRTVGSSTLTAQSVNPSITLPCHMSIFHSVPPARHGILSNTYAPLVRPLPGLFEVLDLAFKRTAAVTNWEELRDVSRPGSLAASHFVRTSYDLDNGDKQVVDMAIPLMQDASYDFMFVYLGTIDSAGHFHGWMSEGYLEQVARVDEQVGRLLDARTDEVMLIQADHGGHDRMHGTDQPEDMTIPWMLMGPGIRVGYQIKRQVSLLDTAPTIAHLLGVQPHAEWEGRAVDEAFLTLPSTN